MSDKNTMQKSINALFKYLFAKNDTGVTEASEKLDISKDTIYGWLSRGNITVKVLIKLLGYCGEKLIIKLKNGEEIELILTDEKPEKNKTKKYKQVANGK